MFRNATAAAAQKPAGSNPGDNKEEHFLTPPAMKAISIMLSNRPASEQQISLHNLIGNRLDKDQLALIQFLLAIGFKPVLVQDLKKNCFWNYSFEDLRCPVHIAGLLLMTGQTEWPQEFANLKTYDPVKGYVTDYALIDATLALVKQYQPTNSPKQSHNSTASSTASAAAPSAASNCMIGN